MKEWCRGKDGVWLCGGHDHPNNFYTCPKCGGYALKEKAPTTATAAAPIPIAAHFTYVGGPFKAAD